MLYLVLLSRVLARPPKSASVSVCLFALFGWTSLLGVPTASPFAMNGWQFQDYNMPKLEEAVNRAPDYGVNFLIFSHDLFRSVEGFLASSDNVDPAHPSAHVSELQPGEYFHIIPGWQTDLRHLGDLATAKGIPFYLWVHEFDDIPKRFFRNSRVNMDDPDLFPYLEKRYERLIEAMPDMAGFVLTLHESDYRVFNDQQVESQAEVPERILRVTQLLYTILQRHHKQLIVRNFFYEPREMEQFAAALAKMPQDIIVMSKDTTHEFHPFYPWDPLHGKVGGRRQIMETDLGVEKAWSNRGAYAQTDYLRRAVLHARDTGLTGVVGRCRLNLDDKPFNDSHEINLYSLSRFMADPTLSTDAVLLDWAKLHYAASAAPYIASAMNRSEFINHHGRWHLEYWFTKGVGADWNNYPYYFTRLAIRGRFKWSHAPADKELEEKLSHPDEITFHRLVDEKDRVIAEVNAAQSDLRQAARWLPADRLTPLEEDFRFLEDAAHIQREWVRAYFAQRMYMDKATEETRMVVEDALKKLEAYEHTPGVTYGLNPESGHRYNIDAFAQEMRWRLANRARALAEDTRLLEDAARGHDVIERARPKVNGGGAMQ